MFLLEPAHPGSPGQRAVVLLCVRVVSIGQLLFIFICWHFSPHFLVLSTSFMPSVMQRKSVVLVCKIFLHRVCSIQL